MALYKVCELIIESNIPLPELPSADGEAPECIFQLRPAHELGPVSCNWFHRWCFPNGDVWLSFARRGSDYLLRFSDLAHFVISAHGEKIRGYPGPYVPLTTIRHLLLDQVIPLVLSQRGRVVLHASAVVAPGGALAFLGVSGQGKSTLAASLSQQGFPLLTDDCLLVKEEGRRLVAAPSYPGLRLWSEAISALFQSEPALPTVAHYTEKRRLNLDHDRLPFSTGCVPLQRVYVLDPMATADGVRDIAITPLSPRHTFMELVKYTYRLDVNDRARLRWEFECFGRMAALPLLYRLTFPRSFARLAAIREAILADLASSVQSPWTGRASA